MVIPLIMLMPLVLDEFSKRRHHDIELGREQTVMK
jgi:hypothetical protein